VKKKPGKFCNYKTTKKKQLKTLKSNIVGKEFLGDGRGWDRQEDGKNGEKPLPGRDHSNHKQKKKKKNSAFYAVFFVLKFFDQRFLKQLPGSIKAIKGQKFGGSPLEKKKKKENNWENKKTDNN